MSSHITHGPVPFIYGTFHTPLPVNCCKITRMALPANTKTGNDITFFFLFFLLVKHLSHISFKILVNFVTSFTRNNLLTAVPPSVVFVNIESYTKSVFSHFTFIQLLLAQRHRIRQFQTELPVLPVFLKKSCSHIIS